MLPFAPALPGTLRSRPPRDTGIARAQILLAIALSVGILSPVTFVKDFGVSAASVAKFADNAIGGSLEILEEETFSNSKMMTGRARDKLRSFLQPSPGLLRGADNIGRETLNKGVTTTLDAKELDSSLFRTAEEHLTFENDDSVGAHVPGGFRGSRSENLEGSFGPGKETKNIEKSLYVNLQSSQKHNLSGDNRVASVDNEATPLRDNLQSRFCGIDTSSINAFLNPPKEVANLIGLAFGLRWRVTKLADFKANTACQDLTAVFNSDKKFIIVGVEDLASSWGALLAGDDAEKETCKRDTTRCKANNGASEAVSSFSNLAPIFPICVALRPCNDADQIGERIRFGFVSGGNSGGDGILIFSYYGVEVYFQGLAFDTAGKLGPMKFSADLIDPINQATTSPKGMHFWLQCKITFPVRAKAKGDPILTVALTAQAGIYGELEIGGKTSSDIVSFIKTLGDVNALVRSVQAFDRATFQFFFDAVAVITVDLAKIFPIKDGSALEVTQSMSAMYEVTIGKANNIAPQYIGCYRDSRPRALPISGSSKTIQGCSESCLKKGYGVSGLQWTGQCWCGGEDYGKYGKTTGCDCREGVNHGGDKNCVYRAIKIHGSCETTWTQGTLCYNDHDAESHEWIVFNEPKQYTKHNCRAACEIKQGMTNVPGCCAMNPITSDGGDSTPWCRWVPNRTSRRNAGSVHYSSLCRSKSKASLFDQVDPLSNGNISQLKQPDYGTLTNKPDVNYDGDASIITIPSVSFVSYESLSRDGEFRFNTHSHARTLCESKGEKLASLSQICPRGPFTKPAHGHKYGVQWAPYDDCDNCWVQVGSHNRCNTHQELYGQSPSWGQDEEEIKPWAKHIMCVSQTSNEPRDEIPKISKMIELMDANDRLIQAHEANLHKSQVHLRTDDYLAGSYMAMYKSMSRKINFSGVLAPLGKFGDWLGKLLPEIKVSIQDYIKIPLSGLPEYIIALEVRTSIDCGILKDIANLIKNDWLLNKIDDEKRVYNAIWPQAARDFCAQKQSASVKMSVGFKGFYPDPPNTYVQIGAGGSAKKLSMAQLPVCPAPVKHGGKCSVNADCVNHRDDKTNGYFERKGFCRNNEVENTGIMTSIACTGTCIERINDYQSCSRDTLKIMDIDPTIGFDSGDDNACKSGNCSCGRCTDDNGQHSLWSNCDRDYECKSDNCVGFWYDCSSICEPPCVGWLCH